MSLLASAYIDPLTGRPVDPSMFVAPADYSYGGTGLQEGERVGGGITGGWLPDWSQIPGFERFGEMLSPSEMVNSGGDYRYGSGDLIRALTDGGYRLYANDQSHATTRGIVDAQGNFVGTPQTFGIENNDVGGFNNALMMMAGAGYGAYTGAGGGAAAGGEAGWNAGGAWGSGADVGAASGGVGAGSSAGASGIEQIPADTTTIPQTSPGPGAGPGASVPPVSPSTGNNGGSPPTGERSSFEQLQEWMRQNPTAGRAIFGLLGGALTQTGGDSGGGGGYPDSGYRPTITRGGWSPTAQAQTTPPPAPQMLGTPGLLNTGQANDGLWRYRGLLGGR